MNPHLAQLQPYPFQRLRGLLAGAQPPADLRHVNLSIGEPKHPAPDVVKTALTGSLEGLSAYPATLGSEALRTACAGWLARRYGVAVDAAREVLPVNGSREALFAFVQTVIDASGPERPVVISPNPFYQIYEGAALLAGAEPFYVNCTAAHRFQPDWKAVPESVWQRTRLVFVCSPGNPTGAVMRLEDWQTLFALSDRYGFVIASDECYSEIYFDAPPLGGLEAASRLGRGFERLVMFTSLSKRSNVPGMRSGFVAGDAALLEKFLLYRTYHGSAMSPVFQAASVAAWNDESHVSANRALYAAKFDAVTGQVASVLDVCRPEAGFYLWARVPDGDDAAFARALFEAEHVTVLPGSFLARDAHGTNPGRGYVRLALVAPLEECIEAAYRIVRFVSRITNPST
ncbi:MULTISPECIES: succinyldiaminopimelate transaminase [Gulbenkiania]|uniref:Putative 8-amino-7-oxononanoate synthase n=2 Tax=Gulbenkiania TaxID=397456 RepID=A0A0K6H8D6_9NEIS|nr:MULTISPECIES: succinyldiaminopimelate transaminase [Gulbenkiania]TCW28468.1 succinyldiaminopimelate aminotransferase [Gulbenkiania mobilis]CUA87144.1 succinyldiaminopimelate aminotransferase apoenzyme [Gulbenkiania indica]